MEARCAAGSGSAPAGADGRFSIDLGTAAALPCVLRASTPTTVLHGALNSGTVANVTPLTELALARAAGSPAASLFDAFDAAAQAKLGTDGLAAARQALHDALVSRVDLGSTDPLSVPFAVGDAHDQQLTALADSLAKARTTLADVAAALVASGATPGTVGTLLQPAHANCAGLRSGRYRVVDPGAPETSNALLQVDAEASTVTLPDAAAPVALTAPNDNPFCNFTFPDASGTGRLLVSPSGLAALLRQRAGSATAQTEASVIVPAQSLPVSELAGTWNTLGFRRDAVGAPSSSQLGTATVDAAGVLTPASTCKDKTCTPATAPTPAPFAAAPDGGFTLPWAGATARAFGFKTADGHVSLLMRLPGNTGLMVAARQEALAPPAVGTASAFWDFLVGADGLLTVGGNGVSTVTSSKVTVTAADAATGAVTRQRTDGRLEQQTLNQPLPGVRYRATNSCSNNGATANCAGTLTLPLPGTGASFYGGTTASSFLGVSTDIPQ